MTERENTAGFPRKSKTDYDWQYYWKCATLSKRNVKRGDEESTHFQRFTENVPDMDTECLRLRGMELEMWKMASEQRTEPYLW